MGNTGVESSSRLEVIAATAQDEPVLANLLELYAHDFSEFHAVVLGDDGRFGYANLPLYWSEAGRQAFLVRVDGKLAGFALVKRGSEISGDESVWDMAEFFVARRYRRSGIGTETAHRVWRRAPGRWEVRVMELNHDAHDFWQRAIQSYAGEAMTSSRCEKGGARWRVFSFVSHGAA